MAQGIWDGSRGGFTDSQTSPNLGPLLLASALALSLPALNSQLRCTFCFDCLVVLSYSGEANKINE